MLSDSIQKQLNNVKSSTLVVDIETSSFSSNGEPINLNRNFDDYIANARVKWVFIYSYKHNKEYYYEASKYPVEISSLLAEHGVMVSFNGTEFDIPILINNGFIEEKRKFLQCDMMQILGTPNQKNKDGYAFKDRGSYMKYKFRKNSLKHIAEVMSLKFQKGDINYDIFHKDEWTSEEKEEIITYGIGDLMSTKGMFDNVWEFWLPFAELLPEKNIYDLSWIRNSIANLTYKCACHVLGVEPTYGKPGAEKEEMGGNVILPPYEELEDVWYVDYASLYPHIFSMLNLYAEIDKDDIKNYEKVWHGNKLFNVKGYYDISQWHKLSKYTAEKLLERANLKKNDPTNPMEYSLKYLLNALYGVARSALFEQVGSENCGWDCCDIGQQFQKFTSEMFDDFGFDTVGGDSVTKDAKLIHDKLKTPTFEELWDKNNNKIIHKNGKEIKLWFEGKILSCNDDFKNIYTIPTEIIRHKVNKKIYKITLSSSDYICVTEDHSLIGLDKNLKMINISPNNLLDKKSSYVIFNRNIPILKYESNNYQKELYNTMGMIVANGSIGKYQVGISFEHIDEYTKKVLSKIKILHNFRKQKKLTDVKLFGKEITDFFGNLGFRGNSKTKHIPKWMFNEKDENICEFLNGCMSGDGTVMMRNHKPIIRYTSVNEQLIDDLRLLFLRVGIATTKFKGSTENDYNGKKSGTYSYYLNILDRNKYKNKIGFICNAKQNRIENVEMTQRVHIDQKEAKWYQKNYDLYFARKVDNLNRDFVPRRIKSIEEIEYADYVYDLSIPKYEKFYANNILVHNTDSLKVKARDPKDSNKEYVQECLNQIVEIIKDNVPFPVDTFDIKIEHHLKYIMWPRSNQEVIEKKIRTRIKDGIMDGFKEEIIDKKKCIFKNDTGELVKIGRSWIKERKSKKKNYMYIYDEK